MIPFWVRKMNANNVNSCGKNIIPVQGNLKMKLGQSRLKRIKDFVEDAEDLQAVFYPARASSLTFDQNNFRCAVDRVVTFGKRILEKKDGL